MSIIIESNEENLSPFPRCFDVISVLYKTRYHGINKLYDPEYFIDPDEIYRQYDTFDDFMKTSLEGYEIIGIAKSINMIPGHYSDYYQYWILIVKSDIAVYYMIFEDRKTNKKMSIENHVCHSHCEDMDDPDKIIHEPNYLMSQFSFHQLKSVKIHDEIRRIILGLIGILGEELLLTKCISLF